MIEDFSFEIKRKIFHISSIIFPLIYIYSSKVFILIILSTVTFIVISFDISRNYNLKINDLIKKIFKNIIRTREIDKNFNLSGSSFMFLGFLLTGIFFSKGLAINSWLILIISDSTAALIGKRFENKKSFKSFYNFEERKTTLSRKLINDYKVDKGKTTNYNIEIIAGKTIMGILSFFVTSILVSLISSTYIPYNTSFFVILIGCFTTTIVEVISRPLFHIDDNLSIPLSFSITITLLNFFLKL